MVRVDPQIDHGCSRRLRCGRPEPPASGLTHDAPADWTPMVCWRPTMNSNEVAASQVFWPTTPSGSRRAHFWNARTEAAVFGPNSPSMPLGVVPHRPKAPRVRTSCRLVTASPVAPSYSVGIGEPVRQEAPGRLVDDAGRRQADRLLELLGGSFGQRAEITVDRKGQIGRAPQPSLCLGDGLARCHRS